MLCGGDGRIFVTSSAPHIPQRRGGTGMMQMSGPSGWFLSLVFSTVTGDAHSPPSGVVVKRGQWATRGEFREGTQPCFLGLFEVVGSSCKSSS